MRINTGLAVTVTSTERWLSELRAGRAFAGYSSQAAVAGEYSHSQLFNPAGSGVNVLVRYAASYITTTTYILFTHYNTALTTNAPTVRNMLSGGAAPAAQVRNASNVAQLGNQFAFLQGPASETFPLLQEWITELGPGEGLVIAGGTVNFQVAGTYYWIEV